MTERNAWWERNKKSIGYGGLATSFFVSLGVLVGVSAVQNNWFPMTLVTTWLVLPLPIALMWGCQATDQDGMIPGMNPYRNFAMWLTGILITVAFGLPLVIYRAGDDSDAKANVRLGCELGADVIMLGAGGYFASLLTGDDDEEYGPLM